MAAAAGPDGSAASVVRLPAHIDEPLEVYVNGVRQEEGTDYELDGRTLRFSRSLVREGKLGKIRWLSIFFGIAGTYRGHETVDVVYRQEGQRLVESGLESRSLQG